MVIYADASVKEIPAEELPKVPQAEDSPKAVSPQVFIAQRACNKIAQGCCESGYPG